MRVRVSLKTTGAVETVDAEGKKDGKISVDFSSFSTETEPNSPAE